ncbi:MAG: 6-carboxytetrahydropterin synthase QueD [Lentisphaerae bacterium RIFOXYC12_FULL_60_16]|nr:MAG: 6-carboxytetrahydropterin synthase QueD [Lentisphaerae bacterium RIFOXYC12_FULL_60_16]OGV68871.1 MAG: 6-carboxytetrahydropterin synthase QueD [Lentisphaerae bacterium RIFOXYA12_FULL_60_10]OGV86244.1 MAG: 6-carboxytetrahydropterin synthase QueD [Lentisphaerae bacterium RIFOXYB12_FULL_60_10]
MYELCIKSHFSAAHHLRGYAGSCEEMHGHNWEIEVFVGGDHLDDTGMLIDFRELKRLVAHLMDQLDHKDLNTLEMFRTINPSSEHIARYLYRGLAASLTDPRITVRRVRVFETPSCSACYGEEGGGC